nr:MAG: hypothetical protein [Wufeng shrew peropuvirus 1]
MDLTSLDEALDMVMDQIETPAPNQAGLNMALEAQATLAKFKASTERDKLEWLSKSKQEAKKSKKAKPGRPQPGRHHPSEKPSPAKESSPLTQWRESNTHYESEESELFLPSFSASGASPLPGFPSQLIAKSAKESPLHPPRLTDNKSSPHQGLVAHLNLLKGEGEVANYTVTSEMIEFLDDPSQPEPPARLSTLKTWAEDCWDHLSDPPVELKAHHFLMCLKGERSNGIKRVKYGRAMMNLEMARATSPGTNIAITKELGTQMAKDWKASISPDHDQYAQTATLEKAVSHAIEQTRIATELMQVSSEQVTQLRELLTGEIRVFQSTGDNIVKACSDIAREIKGYSANLVQQGRDTPVRLQSPRSISSERSSVSSILSSLGGVKLPQAPSPSPSLPRAPLKSRGIRRK